MDFIIGFIAGLFNFLTEFAIACLMFMFLCAAIAIVKVFIDALKRRN